MAGMKFEYDENGAKFVYFLILEQQMNQVRISLTAFGIPVP